MLTTYGLAEVTECPANITDLGVKAAGKIFRSLKSLTIFNSPHLHSPTSWITPNLGINIFILIIIYILILFDIIDSRK